jgi:hypothetical protein
LLCYYNNVINKTYYIAIHTQRNRKKEENKMFTRTLVTAEVSVERIYKDKETGEIKKDCFDEKLPNCKTRDKAEILIEKQYNGDIVSILDIKFKLERRAMTDEQFLLNSDVKSEKIVTEAELQEMKKED